MSIHAASLLRFAGNFLATLLLGSCALWGAFALWYRAPGSLALKMLGVFMWGAFNLALMMALWEGRTALG
ncbi:MAG: hypothetical protein ACRETL_07870, partial [Gammaproteobacteria bacterium]